MNHLHNRPLGRVRMRCRKCGASTMERISDGRALNVIVWLLFSVLSCGLGLLAFPLFTRPKYALHCTTCDTVREE